MIDQETAREQFHAFLSEQCKKSIDQKDTLSAVRKKSWERCTEIGLPTSDVEAFKSIKLGRFFSQNYHLSETVFQQPKMAMPLDKDIAEKAATIVFVNGVYQPSLSNIKALPPSVLVLPLEKAIISYSIFLN